ncbi:MAG: septal ring lytic transglycosylase RlpA family protein [Desulfovibrionaceae bacterium]
MWRVLRTRPLPLALLCCAALAVLAGCGAKTPVQPSPSGTASGTYKPYTIRGKTYYPLPSGMGYVEEGVASWYGSGFHGEPTANGETYDMYALTAAHKTLPMNTMVRVRNLATGREVTVRINDRGPFVRGRIIDLSKTAAREIGIVGPGVGRVRVASLDAVPGYDGTDMAGSYWVQVGAFAVEANARKLLATLRAQGYGGRVGRTRAGGRQLWRVQAGAWPGLVAAQSAQGRLDARYPGCFVIAD